ncbi:Trk system potassium uptake protein TrkH [Bienertia sinuspersici]
MNNHQGEIRYFIVMKIEVIGLVSLVLIGKLQNSLEIKKEGLELN